jgi:hypothetical protein
VEKTRKKLVIFNAENVISIPQKINNVNDTMNDKKDKNQLKKISPTTNSIILNKE